MGDAKVRGISGGEKKRLSLACELIASPSVIFADVELGTVEDVRTRVPSLRHDRTFDVIHAGGRAAAEGTS